MNENHLLPSNGAVNVVPSAVGASGRQRVLLIEGNGFTRLLLVHSLRSAGFEVDFASNGSIALNRFRRRCPDVLLLELQLRGISGVELIRVARRDPHFADRPIYVFTHTETMSRAARKATLVEAAKVFDKSFITPKTLVAQIAADLLPAGTQIPEPDASIPEVSEFSERRETEGDVGTIITELHHQSERLTQCPDPQQRIAICTGLQCQVGQLLSLATGSGNGNLARQAELLEVFLNLLDHEPNKLDDSTVRATIACGVETLELLAADPVTEGPTEFTAIVVDQTASSRTALGDAFLDAGFKPVCFGESANALAHLAANPAQIIVLNGLPPGADGLELGSIRRLALHENTPILAVPFLPELHQPTDAAAPEAARPDVNPIVLMKLVMKALNIVQKAAQSIGASPTTGQEAPALNPPPVATVSPPLEKPVAVELPSLESNGPLGQDETRKTILFVEDDPFVLTLYRGRLEDAGFRIECAEDGLLALDLLPKTRPDLVVLDLMLPKLHGLEVLKFIRADDNLKGTPVLVLSNAYMDGLASKAIAAGADKGIQKTQCTPSKLISVVRELLGTGSVSQPQSDNNVEPQESDVGREQSEESAIAKARAELLAEGPQETVKMRQDCLKYIRMVGSEESLDHLNELYRRVRFLGGRAWLSGLASISDLTSVFEAVLFDIVFKSSDPTPSVLQTIAQAVECLGRMLGTGNQTATERKLKSKVLVVDDDAVFNYTTTVALKRANLDVVCVQDPVSSLSMMAADHFDLVLLDINMPGMDGFVVCEKLRRIPSYENAPVIFVTMHAEFQNRARSVVVGGNDLIGKPVSPLELALKVTMRLLDPGVKSQKINAVVAFAASAAAVPEPRNDLRSNPSPVAEVPSLDLEPQAAPPRMLSGGEVFPTATPSVGDRTSSTALNAPPDMGSDASPAPSADAQPSEDQPGENRRFFESEDAALVPVADVPEPFQNIAAESAKPQEALAKLSKERESLVARIYTAETQLHTTESRVQRRDNTIKSLKQQLEELAAKNKALEDRLTGNGPEAGPSLERSIQPIRPLEAVQIAAEQGEDARKEMEAWCRQLTQDLTKLRQEREELDKQLGQSATEAKQQVEALRNQLVTAAAASKQAAADRQETQTRCAHLEKELSQSAAETKRQLEALRAQLETTTETSKQAESGWQDTQQELFGLRKTHTELNAKYAREQQAVQESAKRIAELEKQLGQSATEGNQQVEALRQQLATAAAASQQAETAGQELQTRCGQLEKELAGSRQAHAELDGKYAHEQQAAQESSKRLAELEKQLNQSAKEAKQELEDLRKQLATTIAANKQAEAGWQETQKELVGLRQTHAELDGKYAREQQAAQESGKRIADLEKQLSQSATEAKQQAEALRQQLATTAAASKQTEADWQETQVRCGQQEKELVSLRQAREELASKYVREQQAAQESGKRIAELEKQLNQSATEAKLQADDLRKQLTTTAAASKQAEANGQELQTRCGQLEKELAGSRQARAELDGKYAREQQAAQESGKRIAELEKQLSHSATEAKQQAEALRQQLATTAAASKQAEANGQELQTRCGQLEKELAGSRQARAELDGKYVREQQAAQESGKRIAELEKQLSQSATEAKQQADDLRKQLATTAAASKQAEAGWQETQTRCGQLEKELAGSRQARAELDGKYVREQQTAQESGKRIAELEKQLNQSATEAKQQAEALRQQLATTAAASKQAEANGQELQTRCGQLEKELAGSRQARAELDGKYVREQQAAQESGKRIAELEKQLSHSATEAKKQAEDLRQQLATATAANKQAEVNAQEFQTRWGQLEKELAGSRQARAELEGKYAREQQASQALSQRIAELEKHLGQNAVEARRAKAESEKRFGELSNQFEASVAARMQAETGRQESQTRSGQLEKELTGLRQEHQELTGKYAQEQEAAQEMSNRIAELEKQRHQSTAEAKQQAEELRLQLATTAAAGKQAKAGWQETQARCDQLEKDLADLRQEREGLTGKFAREQQVSQESARRIAELEKQKQLHETAFRNGVAELENRVRQGVLSLAKVTTELDRERSDHRRLEQHASSLAERLQVLHDELSRNLAADKAVQQRIANLDERLRQREAALARVSADLQQETADRQLAEEQLLEAQGREDQFRKNLSVFEQARRIYKFTHGELESRLAASLGALSNTESSLQKEAGERHRLAEALAATNVSLGERTQKAETLQSQLDTAAKQLAESQSRLQQEATERQRLAEALDTTQRALRDQGQSRELEVSKLESALQLEEVERKRLETQVLQSHRVAFESARTGRVVRNALRRQIRQPIDELCQSTRRLMQSNLDDEQSKLVQAVLENALLVQANLQEAPLSKDKTSAAGNKSPDAEPGQLPSLAEE